MLQLTVKSEDLQAKIDREVAVMRAAIKAELDARSSGTKRWPACSRRRRPKC